MRIGVNTIHLFPQRAEDDLFLRRVLPALREGHPEIELVLFTESGDEASFEGWNCYAVPVSGREGRMSALEAALNEAAEETHVDRLLTPLSAAPAKCPVAVVGLMVDLSTFETPEGTKPREDAAHVSRLKRAADNAATVAVPSEYARRRLLDCLAVPLNKSLVARPGVDHLTAAPQPPTVEKPYLLVGHAPAPEVIQRVIDVLKRIEKRISHTLIVVGEASDNEPEDWGWRILRIHHCPADQLAGLYQHCDLALCIAQDDASAMAVLEAMQCGAPVVAAKTGAVPEVAHNVPFYCDPVNAASIAVTILHALDEEETQRVHRIRSGRQTAAEFTWTRCADRLYKALIR